MAAPPADLAADARVTAITGDATDEALLAEAIRPDTASVYHLAAVVSAGAVADFDLGMRVNLDAPRTILEISRPPGTRPTRVSAISRDASSGALSMGVEEPPPTTPK